MYYTYYTDYTYYGSGHSSPQDIRIPGIGQTQGSFLLIIRIMVQVTALLGTLEFQESAKHKGHFALFNCLVLGHTKYKGVQRVYCNPYPAKPFHCSHRLDMVIIRPPGIDNGGFVVSPDTSGMLGFCFYSQHLL